MNFNRIEVFDEKLSPYSDLLMTGAFLFQANVPHRQGIVYGR